MNTDLSEYFRQEAEAHERKNAMLPDEGHVWAAETLRALAGFVGRWEAGAADARNVGKPVPDVQRVVVALGAHVTKSRSELSLDGEGARQAVMHYGYGGEELTAGEHTRFLVNLLTLCEGRGA